MASPLSARPHDSPDIWRPLGELASSMRALAGTAAWRDSEVAATLDQLDGTLAAAEGRGGERGAVGGVLRALATAQAAVRAHTLGAPFEALSRIHEGLARVRRETNVTAIFEAGARELCHAAGFDRAWASRVSGSTWTPRYLYVANRRAEHAHQDAVFADFVVTAEIPLTSNVLEAELVRRRVAALVLDAPAEPRVFRPLLDAAGATSYVVAPVITGNSVVGLLHADVRTESRALTEFDRDNLQTFADGVGLICERAVLLERLEAQRERVRTAMAASETVIDGLTDRPVLLRAERALRPRWPVPPISTAPGVLSPVAVREPRSSAHDGLTMREREVLGLMSSGATNAQIADQLTVSESTVKSHVKHILRKLGAANRTEAIARCLSVAAQGRWAPA